MESIINNRNDLQARIAAHQELVCKEFGEDRVIGVFLYGSQNYGLDTPTSDVDSCALILPTLEEIALNAAPCNVTKELKNGEHIVCKDMRLWMGSLRKQGLPSLELMFSRWVLVNPDYAQTWLKLNKMREQIAHYNYWRVIKNIHEQMKARSRMAFDITKSRREVVAPLDYDPKSACYALYYGECLDKYISHKPFELCIKVDQPVRYQRIRAGWLNRKDAQDFVKSALDTANITVEGLDKEKLNQNVDEVWKKVQELQVEFITKSLQIQMKGDK